MIVAIGSDHAGFAYKQLTIQFLRDNNYQVVDCGTYDEQSCDYTDFAVKVANSVVAKQCKFGIVICGTGIGISIAANKVNGIRCANCTNEFMATVTRQHNDANILAFGSRVVDIEMAYKMTKLFLTTEYEGGRHQRRIDKITAIENSRNGEVKNG